MIRNDVVHLRVDRTDATKAIVSAFKFNAFNLLLFPLPGAAMVAELLDRPNNHLPPAPRPPVIPPVVPLAPYINP
jgi:hypothetical protein